MPTLRTDPLYTPIRDHPRFQALLEGFTGSLPHLTNVPGAVEEVMRRSLATAPLLTAFAVGTLAPYFSQPPEKGDSL